MIKPNLIDFSDAYVFVRGNIAVVVGDNNTKACFKNCTPFTRCVTHLNSEHVETAENLDLIMNLYNLIKYSDNYSDTSGSLWQYKRDEQNMTAAGAIDNVNANSSSLKCNSDLLKGLTKKDIGANTDPNIAGGHKLFTNAQTVDPLKYLSIFFRSLEMPLLNTKLQLELNWTKFV